MATPIPSQHPATAQDQAAALVALATAVHQLSGELAALTAYVVAATGPLLATEMAATRELAQQIALSRIGVLNGSAPGDNVSEGVAKIHLMAENLASTRAAAAAESDESPGSAA